MKFKYNSKDDFLPWVHVKDVDAYFALPKEKRTNKYGLYLEPSGLPFNIDDILSKNEGQFDQFSRRIRKEFPIQWFFRDWCVSYDNPIYTAVKAVTGALSTAKYNIKRFIRPEYPRFRKAYPRWAYMDLTQSVVDINEALILDFWYEEVVDGIVDWHFDDHHQKIYDWLEESVNWIESERAAFEEKSNKAHDKIDHTRDETYEIKYKEVNELDKLIKDTDTKMLKELIEYRDWLWT